ncbi:MAG TPA: DUF222 domain-containing protein, partial [Acidimicrobiales bacterium]|nr:DUF222 domain-containing protein [Acidimicrobiales bacterium]
SDAKIAEALRSLPVTAVAWRSGELSGAQVQAIVANVPRRHRELFASHEAEIIPTLVGLSVHETTVAMNLWRERADALDGGPEPKERPDSAHLSQLPDGTWRLDANLSTEAGALADAAIKAATSPDAEDERRTATERRADSLADIFRWYLRHRAAPPATRNRPNVNVVVDLEALALGLPGDIVGGGSLDAASIKRLLCDTGIHRVVTDGRSTILDYGRQTRTISEPLWNALVLRDRHCRWPGGCDRKPDWCEAHHVVPWTEGGETNLWNLVLDCTRHHHIVHLPGWHSKLLPDGTFVVTDPQGRVKRSRPPGVLPTDFGP